MLPVAATLVRVVIGIMFLVHVWGKFNAGHARIATAFGNNYGLPIPGLFAYAAMGMELIGGICLIIGLFTRFWAAALAVEIGIALIVAHLPKGYSVGAGRLRICPLDRRRFARDRHARRRTLFGRRQDRQGTLRNRQHYRRARHYARARFAYPDPVVVHGGSAVRRD